MKDHRGIEVTPHVAFYSRREEGPPWRPAGWWAVYWSADGMPREVGRKPDHLLRSCRTRAEAEARLAECLAEVEAERAARVRPLLTRLEAAAIGQAAMAKRWAEYEAALADPNMLPWDLPPKPYKRDPNRPRPAPRKPPSTLTFEYIDGGWRAAWWYACVNVAKRWSYSAAFSTEAEARAYAANRWQGRPAGSSAEGDDHD